MKQLDKIYCNVYKDYRNCEVNSDIPIKHKCKFCKTNPVEEKNQSCREFIFQKSLRHTPIDRHSNG